MPGYNPSDIEKKWQNFWAANKTFATPAHTGDKPKYYALDMFPYPSGQGLHVGHPEGYTATDIVSRFKRAKGFNVLHPMGWDAFGLPAEQYAIKNNVHPKGTTATNISRFRGQLQSIGFSYDWDREVDTTDPSYYKWTQWIFLQLFDTWFDETQQKGRPIAELIAEFVEGKRKIPGGKSWTSLSATEQRKILEQFRLACEADLPVNWCPGLGTVLSNEDVIDGKSEVGGFPVERRPMRQWILRITAYAERLISGLKNLDWADSTKLLQTNWIGRSEGAHVTFKIEGRSESLQIFTTRPDTLFGATYMVMAPEHPLVDLITAPTQREKIAAYKQWAASRSDRDRQMDTTKTGEATGAYAINPVSGERIPIYISDYVLMGYGTGAIMAVPAHDARDHEFATKFKLPIIQVVGKNGETFDVQKKPFEDEGVAVNSPWIDGLPTQQAKSKINVMLEEKGIGKKAITYKIRDWLFSRQRYWGEPFPLVHLEDGTVVALADDQLPLKLPELEDFKPTGTIDPPLSKAQTWLNVHVTVDAAGRARVVPAGTPGAQQARRELNTMPQWAGSCWYYLRYCDARNEKAFVDPAIEKFWMHNGVDLYIGGVEHAVLHLLYSRFWHKVLFDRGLVSCDEPFRKLVNQGLILGDMEYTIFRSEKSGEIVSIDDVSDEWDSRPSTKTDEGGNAIMETIATRKSSGELLIAETRSAEDTEKQGTIVVLKSDPKIRVDARSFKMSKSRGNVVNPDDVIKDYGADSLRLFEMFMGPLEQVKPWSTAGVEGVYRFLQRVWRNLFDENDSPKVVDTPQDDATNRAMHKLIKRVGDDIERLSFNTAIAGMMEFNNLLAKAPHIARATAVNFARVIEPFAPHFAEEVHARLTQSKQSVCTLPWPGVDAALLVDATVEIPVQINGKLAGRVTVANNAGEEAVVEAALANAEVQLKISGKPLKKKIYVKGRMLNLVI